MNIVVAMVALFSGVLSLLGIISPETLRDVVGLLKKKAGFAFSIISRVVVGILFIFAAPSCLLSGFIYVVGLFIIAAAGLLAIAGPKRFEALFNWWTGLAPFEIRAWAFVSALFCGSLIYASGWTPIG